MTSSKKANEPWSLGVSPSPSATEDELFLAVGKALTMWERLDTALAMTFGHLVGTQHVVALRAIGLIESPAARINVIREAFLSSDDEVQKAYPSFKRLLIEVEQFTRVRNAIAHGQVHGIRITGRPKAYYLVPGFSATRKIKHFMRINQQALISASSEAVAIGEVYTHALSAERILEFRDEFARLLQEVESWQMPSANLLMRPTSPELPHKR